MENFKLLQTIFTGNEDNFAFEYEKFKKSFKKIVEDMSCLSKCKRTSADKQTLMKVFSIECWNDLSPESKSKHSLYDCNECLDDPQLKVAMELFYIKGGNSFKPKCKCKAKPVPSKRKIEEIVSSTELNSHNKSIVLAYKKSVEDEWKKTSVARAFGVNVSLNTRKTLRMAESFETKKEAEVRTRNEIQMLKDGKKRKHKPIANLDRYQWQSKDCLEFVNSLVPGSCINYSLLALEYGLKDPGTKDNKNQVVKEFLIENGVDLSQFLEHRKGKSKFNVRRKKRRLDYGVSIPVKQTNEQISMKLKEEILEGKYSIGELIVPCVFKKCFVTQEGLKWEEFAVEGRKNSLKFLREKFFSTHKALYRIKNDSEVDDMSRQEIMDYFIKIQEYDEGFINASTAFLKNKLKSFQRRRHISMWHDGATICNHSHVLFMVSILYDIAIHYTDEEVLEMSGKSVDVQATIETPEIYILGRCPGTTELTAYSEIRMEDIIELVKPLSFNGTNVYDIMRFFKGDGPSCQFEAGQQKGGNYFCWKCGINSERVGDYAHAAYHKTLTLQDRQQKVLQTTGSIERSQKGITKVYNDLDKADIVQELHERSVKFTVQSPTAVLKDKLITEMHGIQRVLSLLFNTPEKELDSIGLQFYEMLCTESLHDVSNQIKNCFLEMPHHVKDKNYFMSVIDGTFGGKDCRRAVDYRSSLVKVYVHCKTHYPQNPLTLLFFTLCEIQRVLYQQESERTNENILHLYLQVFLHMMVIKMNFEKKLKVLSRRKFFGKYYHAIIAHASDQYRIINGRSSNTENEERCFNFIKTVSKGTSNHHPDNIISNAFIRSQVRKEMEDSNTIMVTESLISSSYNNIRLNLENSVISFDIIEKYPWEYQALLEKIADFLQYEGLFWHEVENGVRFSDITCVNSKKQVHHFRTYDISEELKFVEDCWKNSCLKYPNVLIPAFKIKIEDDEGIPSIIFLKTLNKYNTILQEEDTTDNSMLQPLNDMDIEDVSQPSLLTSVTESCSSRLFPDFIVTSTPKPKERDNKSNTMRTISDIPSVFQSPNNAVKSTIKESINTPVVIESTSDTPVFHSSDDDSDEEEEIQDNIHQILPISSVDIVVPKKKENVYEKLSLIILKVLGESELIKNFDAALKKLTKYPQEEMYKEMYDVMVAKVEVKIKNKFDNLNRELKEIQSNRLTSTCSLAILPTNGVEKEVVDAIIQKLKYIKVLKSELNLQL